MSEVNDKQLKEEAKIFIRQEAQHYLEHEKFFQILEAQGYQIEGILKVVENVVTTVSENYLSPKSAMAITAGCEHITALLSEIALKDNFFKDSPEELKGLFEWHSMEELEHRAVAYDVFNHTDGRYINRVIGLLGAYVFFTALTCYITCALMKQDKTLFKKGTLREATDIFFIRQKLLPKASRIFFRYLLPDFHPNGNPSLEDLATSVIDRYAATGVA